jgi:ATP synthase subunit 6
MFTLFDQFLILPSLLFGKIYITPYILVSVFLTLILVLGKSQLRLIYSIFPYIFFLLHSKKPIEKITFLLVLCSFSFILLGNFIGFLPYSTTITSQLSLTFFLSIWLIGGICLDAIKNFNISMLQYYLPKHTTNLLSWLLIPLELISFCIRPFSLSIRLFANTVCGHILIKLIVTCIMALFQWWAFLTIFIGPCLFICIFICELFIASLQAYIFVLLFSIYKSEISCTPTYVLKTYIPTNLLYLSGIVYLKEYWYKIIQVIPQNKTKFKEMINLNF